MNIGCVSFGALGQRLVDQLARRYEVALFDATGANPNRLNLAALVACSDVIVVCGKPAEEDLHDVVFEHDGFAAGLTPGKILVDLTSGDPESTRSLSNALMKRGVQLVDAPVHAEIWADLDAHAAIFCGGDGDAVAKVKPLLECITPRVVAAGPSGNGHATYLVVQAIAICNRVVTCECASLGAKQGLSVRDMDTVLNNSSGQSSASARLLPSFHSAQPTADVPLDMVVQDLQIFSRAAASFGAPVLIGNLARSIIEMASNDLPQGATLDDVSRFYESTGAMTFSNG
jgi:3-hydroxyisobutyrate dehydrogenase